MIRTNDIAAGLTPDGDTYGTKNRKERGELQMPETIIKRTGEREPFDRGKIRTAARKAFEAVGEKYTETSLDYIAELVTAEIDAKRIVEIEDIQDAVERTLMKAGYHDVARAYIKYRYRRQLARRENTTDESIMALLGNRNPMLAGENSNKDTTVAATQRDYIAGEVSRDMTQRIFLPPHIAAAHDEAVLHFHDTDYFIQDIFNCALLDIGDMLDNGTCINKKKIDPPNTFRVACTVVGQIIGNIGSNQYGGQSVDTVHLGKYLRKSRDKFERRIRKNAAENHIPQERLETFVRDELADELKEELAAGVQTLQYQINTFMTTNGQAPFVTLFLYLRHDDPYLKENAMIVREILEQRIRGIKNEDGVYTTPAFPKLVYVLDEINCLKGGDYDDITRLAVKCTATRMYPDYISAKKMRENYEGNVFSPMGCVAGDEVVTYKLFGRVYVESFARMWTRLAHCFAIKEQKKGCRDYLYMDTPDGVEIFDTKRGFVKNQRIIRNKNRKWLRVKFSNGRAVTCTPDHPFTAEGRTYPVRADQLVPEHKIRINHGAYSDGTIPYDKDLAWTYGAMLCDSAYGQSISLSIAKTGEDEIQSRFTRTVKDKFGLDIEVINRERGCKGCYKDLTIRSDGSEALTRIRTNCIGMFEGIKKSDRHIPNEVFSWDKASRMAFLAGIVDADGYLNDNMDMPKIQVGSTNKELALQEMLLAQSLGMTGAMYDNHYKSNCRDKIRYRVEFIATKEFVDMLECGKKKTKFTSWVRRNNSVATADICTVRDIEPVQYDGFSYDVTTESGHFEVSGIYSHNCRSFLAPWIDADGNYKFEGRFNQGVVSINLPQIGIIAAGDEDKFWSLLDERLQLCFEALMIRHKALCNVTSDVSPLHWQYGAISRLPPHTPIKPMLYGGYSSISLGYIGLYECTVAMKGCSHTKKKGQEFALRVMRHLRETCDRWKAETDIGFALYGTPAESLCYRFARIDRQKFGVIENITDKGYYTNSYHVDVREKIDLFKKFIFEDQFQPISSGGCISYAEIPNMCNNLKALEDCVAFIYDNIQYAEFNTKDDVCGACGYRGEIGINPDGEWECPNCHCTDQRRMTIVRRTCGYLGENYWNRGKTKEIGSRVEHL